MTSPSKYKVVETEHGPEIVLSLMEGDPKLAWRDAKRELRKWYLNKAASLRKVTEDNYFNK